MSARFDCPCCGQPVTHGDPAVLLAAIPLGPMKRRILDVLITKFGAYVSTDALVQQIYADDPNGGPDSAHNGIAVQMVRLRAQLPGAFTIDSGAWKGYRLRWAHEAVA